MARWLSMRFGASSANSAIPPLAPYSVPIPPTPRTGKDGAWDPVGNSGFPAVQQRQLDAWMSHASEVPSVWDLSKLAFLSSAGIRSLLLLDRRVLATGYGKNFVLAIGSPLHRAASPMEAADLARTFWGEAG